MNTLVDFPLENLDLSSFLPKGATKNTKFNLIGVNNHLGGLNSGHYTAHVKKTKGDNKWYNMNDSSCSVIEEPEKKIVSSDAYMLFYETVDEQDYKWPTDEFLNDCYQVVEEEDENKKEEENKGEFYIFYLFYLFIFLFLYFIFILFYIYFILFYFILFLFF